MEPEWLDDPALSRITISSPRLLAPFAAYNRRRSWVDQIKPFNFLLVAHVLPLGEPSGVSPAQFRLVAPYVMDRTEWTRMPWRNLYEPNGHVYRISTSPHDATKPRASDVADVVTYRVFLTRYLRHPESKYADERGRPCGPDTRGRLQRRAIRPRSIVVIGKETNELDQVQAGLHANAADATAAYLARDAELADALAATAHLSGRQLATLLAVDRRTIDRMRAGAVPRRELRAATIMVAREACAGADQQVRAMGGNA